MLLTWTAMTDKTSTVIRLNSSKQPQAPVCARPWIHSIGIYKNISTQSKRDQLATLTRIFRSTWLSLARTWQVWSTINCWLSFRSSINRQFALNEHGKITKKLGMPRLESGAAGWEARMRNIMLWGTLLNQALASNKHKCAAIWYYPVSLTWITV